MDDFSFDGEERCSGEMWEHFFDHVCWKEFLDTIKMRLSIARTELENAENEEVKVLQGEAKTLRFVLNFENIIKQEIKEKEVGNEKNV